MATKHQARPKSKLRYRRYESNATLSSVVRSTPQFDLSALLSVRVLTMALLALVVGVALWLGFDDRFYVTSINVTGNTRASAADIAAKSGALGQHIFWIKPQAVAQQLTTSWPSIRNATMTCTFPADCTLQVEERQPIVAWQFGNATTWIDKDHVAFAAEGKNNPKGLITIEAVQGPALFPGQHADQQLIDAASAVAQAMPEIQHYRYTVAHGLEFNDARGFPVYLGVGQNMADRVMVWKALSANLKARNILPKFVDVQYPLAPYYGQ